jgi:Fe2+ transport system protein FeoA
MNEKVFITEEFKAELRNLGCMVYDHINIYRVEGNNVFFSADKCKFSLTKKELEEVRVKSDLTST